MVPGFRSFFTALRAALRVSVTPSRSSADTPVSSVLKSSTLPRGRTSSLYTT
eukprot:CAMPEP_0202915322 /NCGR_PEP_ID=MMETSP1392-20130828/65353_1 /ASSEMBLY_ACC=CAM_ASM_000868 /TAXON_ID=225041 /ORGANISM="Chlamydomonas chlamydogama, Strain SAG 11-48b" /LENGTH=51 /DNA_ID=CAMNT_0049607289 /DNA_START=78 /DNA_END=229 /DNA_ORIENTATION=+